MRSLMGGEAARRRRRQGGPVPEGPVPGEDEETVGGEALPRPGGWGGRADHGERRRGSRWGQRSGFGIGLGQVGPHR